MADQAETTSAEPAAPAAEPVAAEKPDRSDRGKQSFAERMEQLGWDKKVPHSEVPESLGAKARAAEATEPADPADEPTKPDVVKPKTEPPKPETPTEKDEKRKQLAELVKELGMQMEDGKVTVAERAALREERRQAKAEIVRLEQEAKARTDAMVASLEEREAKLKPGMGKLEQFERAVADDDHEAIAKLMGFEDYDKWQEHIIGVKSDPNYKTLRSLKERVEKDAQERADREAAAAKDAEEQAAKAEQTERQRKQQEIDAGYCRDLSKQMAESDNPLLKAFSDDPQFVGAVFRIQKENWDGVTPMPIEQAIKTPARGAKVPLEAELKRIYDKLVPIFSTPVSSPGATVAAVKAGVGKPAPEPAKKVGRTPAPTKPPPVTEHRETEQERKRRWTARMEEAARADAAAKRRAG